MCIWERICWHYRLPPCAPHHYTLLYRIIVMPYVPCFSGHCFLRCTQRCVVSCHRHSFCCIRSIRPLSIYKYFFVFFGLIRFLLTPCGKACTHTRAHNPRFAWHNRMWNVCERFGGGSVLYSQMWSTIWIELKAHARSTHDTHNGKVANRIGRTPKRAIPRILISFDRNAVTMCFGVESIFDYFRTRL